MRLTEYDLGFRFKKNVFTVAGVIDRYHDQRIFLYPDHIYSKPWHKRAKSTFVESVLLGMPTTEFWCEEDNYGAISVLDGTQRLQCLLDFCNDKFPLQDLKLLPNLNDKHYSNLPYRYASTLSNRAELYFTIISYDTHPALKFEFFKRINSDSYRFPVQAARNFAFRDHFLFIRETQKTCIRYLKHSSENSDLPNKNDYLHTASFDELLLLLAALTLTFHNVMRADQESSQDLLDEAAMVIHFSNFSIDTLKDDIRANLRKIYRLNDRAIYFDPLPSFSSRRSSRFYGPSMELRLTQNQIANLYIYALRGELNSTSDLNEILETSPRASIRSASTYYRRLFR